MATCSYLEVLGLSFWWIKVLTGSIDVSPVPRQGTAPRRQDGLVRNCALSIAQMIQDNDFQTMSMEILECRAAVDIVQVALLMVAKMSLFILIAYM